MPHDHFLYDNSHSDERDRIVHRARMAKRRHRKKSSSPPAATIVAFTDVDEAFFAVGATYEQPAPVESFDDLDAGAKIVQPRTGFWRRLFSRAA